MGKETIVPQDKLAFDDGIEPHIICPLHQCVVYLGVIPKEERDEAWAHVKKGTKIEATSASQPGTTR